MHVVRLSQDWAYNQLIIRLVPNSPGSGSSLKAHLTFKSHRILGPQVWNLWGGGLGGSPASGAELPSALSAELGWRLLSGSIIRIGGILSSIPNIVPPVVLWHVCQKIPLIPAVPLF